ncbi:hypothetical protein [Streptomyces monashensis]|uniref:Uncharacterized protein n=1 Tax=Streptomyces monashensis TaxID=1678012 RepID=A0A1S2Q142_9ACTN|nr:hypothetical protein [Streptomyces monashensis]OIJ99831.1 hypothetical protein BIV23_27785 [Streptomyces monashensis]
MQVLAQWKLAGAPVEGVPAGLAASCARVGHDLLAEPVRLPGLRWWAGREGTLPGILVGLRTDEGTRFGSRVVPDDDVPAMTVGLAEAVQDHLAGYEFIQWPSCPGHRHPMRPSVEPDNAWWTCPASRRKVSVIGQLPPA